MILISLIPGDAQAKKVCCQKTDLSGEDQSAQLMSQMGPSLTKHLMQLETSSSERPEIELQVLNFLQHVPCRAPFISLPMQFASLAYITFCLLIFANVVQGQNKKLFREQQICCAGFIDQY